MAPGVVTYVNHEAFGGVPLPVVRAEYKTRRQLIDANPMDFYRRRIAGELDRSWLAIAGFLASDEQGVVLAQNTTTDKATVLASPWLGPSDRILVSERVYGAVRWNTDPAARRTGGVVDEMSVAEYQLLLRLILRDGVTATDVVYAALADRLPGECLIECPGTARNGRALLRLCAQFFNSKAGHERVSEGLKGLR